MGGWAECYRSSLRFCRLETEHIAVQDHVEKCREYSVQPAWHGCKSANATIQQHQPFPNAQIRSSVKGPISPLSIHGSIIDMIDLNMMSWDTLCIMRLHMSEMGHYRLPRRGLGYAGRHGFDAPMTAGICHVRFDVRSGEYSTAYCTPSTDSVV